MKKITAFTVLVLLLTSIVAAQPQAGTTPDSALWGLDVAFDKLSLALTRGNEKKAQKALAIADERLAELEKLTEERKLDQIDKVSKEHKDLMRRTQEYIAKLEQRDKVEEFEHELEIEKRVQEHKDKVASVHLKIQGQLNDEQQAALEALIASLGDNVEQVEIKIRTRQNQTKIKIREELDDGDDRIEELESTKYQRLALHEQDKALERIQKAKEKLQRFAQDDNSNVMASDSRKVDTNRKTEVDASEKSKDDDAVRTASELIRRVDHKIESAHDMGVDVAAAQRYLDQAEQRLEDAEHADSEQRSRALAKESQEYANDALDSIISGMGTVTGKVTDMDDNETENESEEDECTLDSDCEEGLVCIAGECEDVHEENETDDDLCSVDEECDSDEFCMSGECEEKETDDDEKDDDDSEKELFRDLDDNILRQYNLSIPRYEQRTVESARQYLHAAEDALDHSESLYENEDYKASYAYAKYARKLANRALSGKYLNEIDERGKPDRMDFECKTDDQCDDDEVCIEFECEDIENDDDGDEDEIECTSDAQCNEDEVCIDNECEDVDDDSEADEINETDEIECAQDSQCETDEVCIDNECEDVDEIECTTDADCSDDKVCLEGECESTDDSSSGSSDECTSDDQCKADETCIESMCVDREE